MLDKTQAHLVVMFVTRQLAHVLCLVGYLRVRRFLGRINAPAVLSTGARVCWVCIRGGELLLAPATSPYLGSERRIRWAEERGESNLHCCESGPNITSRVSCKPDSHARMFGGWQSKRRAAWQLRGEYA